MNIKNENKAVGDDERDNAAGSGWLEAAAGKRRSGSLPPVLLETLRRARRGCSWRERRFLKLNVRGRESLSEFSNKMSKVPTSREFLAIRCMLTVARNSILRPRA